MTQTDPVISVVHDLSLARAYGTDALLINQGQLVDVGSAQDVLSRANLKDVYSHGCIRVDALYVKSMARLK